MKTEDNQAQEEDQTEQPVIGDASNDNGDNDVPEQPNEAKLEKLYKRLPKIIAMITLENENENHVALKNLLEMFAQINTLEKSLLQPDQNHEELNLPRLYELAVSGGGSGENLEELKQANTAFEEENTILAESIESLSFQLDTLKRQSADEVLELGKGKSIPLKDLKKALGDVNKTMSNIQEQLSVLDSVSGNGENEESSEKPLDEKFTEGLGGLGDITAELLKASPRNITFFGKILRRAGFAYDHKDLATVRQLVLTVIRANKKLADVNATLAPAQEQIQQLQQIVSLIELYAGHEERQTVQYKDAMEEIERLQTNIGRYEEKHGALEDLDQTFETKKAEIEEQEKELDDLNGRKELIVKDLEEKEEELKSLSKSYHDVKDDNDALKKEIETKESEIENLGQKITQLETDATRLKNTHRSEMAALRNRMRMIKDGLLVEKLESEITALREMTIKSEEKIEAERESYKAFEERVEIWIQNEEKLQKQVNKWQKRAGLKYSFMAAAAGITALGGFALANFMAAEHVGNLGWYFGLIAGIPAVVTGLIIGSNDGMKEGIVTGLLAGSLGVLLAGVGLVPIQAYVQYEKKLFKNELYESLNKFCVDAPCLISQNEEGDYSAEALSEKYQGGTVTFDFTDKSNPRIIHLETMTSAPVTGTSHIKEPLPAPETK